MTLPIQIEAISIGRAANAPHYEYMTTFGKRTAELPVDHELWRKGKDEFDTAFKAEDEAFKRYRDSELTDPLKVADEERDKPYASLRDTIKAYAKFPTAETAQHAEPLLRVVRNYKIKTTENYMKESGLVDNMLQDLFQYRTQLRRLGLEILADRLKAANDHVRQLLTERNDQRSAQIMGELKAAREATDRAYLTLVRLTNAYALLNPGEYHPKCFYTIYDTNSTTGAIDTFSYYSPIIIGDYTIDDKVISIVWDEDWNELDSIVELTANRLVYVEHLIEENIHLRITKTLRKVK